MKKSQLSHCPLELRTGLMDNDNILILYAFETGEIFKNSIFVEIHGSFDNFLVVHGSNKGNNRLYNYVAHNGFEMYAVRTFTINACICLHYMST